jgi:putative NADH-flavin reductase
VIAGAGEIGIRECDPSVLYVGGASSLGVAPGNALADVRSHALRRRALSAHGYDKKSRAIVSSKFQ